MVNEQLIVHENKSVLEALEKINQNTTGTIFIVDSMNSLVGILTDGDIRRAILNGYSLSDEIKNIMVKEYSYAHIDESPIEAIRKTNDKIRILPVLDDQNQVVDYIENKTKFHLPVATPQLTGKELQYLVEAFLSTWISSSGHYILTFEELFSRYCGMAYGVAVSNGTTALHLALLTLGIKKGDEVIVPDFTFAATINAVLYTGATPVIVDICEDNWCISPDSILKAITPNTKAIIPVHIYGQPCNMDRICSIAREHHLFVVEDCAEAHGAEFKGKKVGSFGDIGCFSFYANKVITTGEGGMCITNNPDYNEKMRIYRDHGMNRQKKYYHDVIGYNYRMTNLQAAIGTAQLERIDEILQWRFTLERDMRAELEGIPIEFQQDIVNCKRIVWLITMLVSVDKRDACIQALSEKKIDARPVFIPLSKMKIYKKYAISTPVSEALSMRGLSLPTLHDLSNESIKTIANTLRSILQL